MRSWWVKLSSKEEKKKANKESVLDAIQRKIKITSEQKSNSRSGGSHKRNDTPLQRGSVSRVPSRSPSPSKHVSRCQSFAERPQPRAQPLPLPVVRHSSIKGCDSGLNESERTGRGGCSNPLHILPLPKTYCVPNQLDQTDAEADLATASVSSDGSNDSDDPSDSHFLSPVISDHENGNKTNANTPSSILHRNHSPGVKQKSLKDTMKPPTFSLDNEIPSLSPKRAPKSNRVQNIQIPPRGAFFSAPDSSMSSPSTSPLRSFFAGRTCTDVGLLSSGQCSSPGSGYNSGQNSIGGDMSGQLFWPNSRCSPECSPIPSPKNISPGPSSRIHSGAVTPTHPRAGGITAESPSNRPDDGKHPSHRLPLPPISITKTGPFSPTYSTSTSPSVPRSPNRSENSISPPGSRWKKGRQLGRGTFGDVFLGFNRESGEMCAMKEVTLFTDDPKSRESAQQLGQEVMLLSRLRHPNIVQYYGSEMVDDKLYIYLEYVSGGSIYKLLQDYGQFGEIAIRSYTRQILSGLAYLHGKNTVHRDIKGANILVDPSGRVKLADFGMAKHITGQACPLSFKGSPHWMAPEVMNNANGCNLAVDIWSLGCTVVEMATTKPPWSQYEGVAALFKIGHSKEQPAIPEKLSEEGKDFVRKCLQRNPFHRPTAAKLLEHPFVKNAAPLERPIMIAEPLESTPHTMDVGRSMGFGHPRNFPGFESEGAAVHQPRGLANGLGSSDFLTPKNLSSPVSPIGSPLWNSRSPALMSGRISPSPISSPPTVSGSSSPLTGGGGAIPFNHSMQPPLYFQESIGLAARSQNNFYSNSSNAYQEPKMDHFPGILQASHIFREVASSANISAENPFRQPARRDLREHHNGQSVLANCVSQQLLKDHGKLKPTLDLNPGASMLRPTDRI